LRISPDDAALHYQLGSVLARQRQPDEATWHYNEALRLKPDYPEARRQLQLLSVPPKQ
jgi:Flp pilus assembly protein TadD